MEEEGHRDGERREDGASEEGTEGMRGGVGLGRCSERGRETSEGMEWEVGGERCRKRGGVQDQTWVTGVSTASWNP